MHERRYMRKTYIILLIFLTFLSARGSNNSTNGTSTNEVSTINESNNKELRLQNIYQEMIFNKSYIVSPNTDKAKFETIWDLIQGHWYASDFVQMINDKKLFINNYNELNVANYDTEDSESITYYNMTEFDYMVGDSMTVSSFHIKPEDELIWNIIIR